MKDYDNNTVVINLTNACISVASITTALHRPKISIIFSTLCAENIGFKTWKLELQAMY